ncbi:MAG TPA: hypothetical protein VNI84_16345, partial [Pyrinomonadaceae bacterium]|nr:hypothetical protein [Pyrinomonadaceae bacterium]
ISTTFDRYGNRTETRTFDNNPRLAFIILRTSLKGKKQVFVYGQNGDVKSLPENMLDKILTATANDLAAAAGISEGRAQSQTFVQSTQPLKTMPSYKFPVQMPLPQLTPPETVEITAPKPVETLKPPTEATITPPKTEKLASKIPTSDLD